MSLHEIVSDQPITEEYYGNGDSELLGESGFGEDTISNGYRLSSYQNTENDKLEDSDSGCDATSTAQPRDDEPLSAVDKVIIECRIRRSVSLDLSRSELQTLPEAVLRLEHIEYLHLEGNEISKLPEDFFKYFPRLKWLDLRRNHLVSLPSLHLGSHRCLRTLLLEDNELQMLPLELGLLRSLDGLNLRKNSIEFPPAEIIDKGTKKILIFLRRMLKAVKDGDQASENNLGSNVHSTGNSDLSSDEDDVDSRARTASSKVSSDKAKLERRRSVPSAPVTRVATTDPRVKMSAGDVSSKPSSSLQCLSFAQISKRIEKKYLSQTEKYVPPVDDVITEGRIQAKYSEEKRLAKIRNRKGKQDEIIQSRKNLEIVKNFREETKRLQAKKLAEKRLNGGFIDFTEPVATAPFGVVADEFKMMTNAERIQQKATNEKKLELRSLSPETLIRLEEQRVNKERMLREKIREHALAVQSRRQKPYGNPLEDMKAAQRELEAALELQREVEQRRRDLEYRFTAHTVDAIDSRGLPNRLGSRGDRK